MVINNAGDDTKVLKDKISAMMRTETSDKLINFALRIGMDISES